MENLFRIVANGPDDARRIKKYIVDNYGGESVGSFVPGSSEVTLVCHPGSAAEYDFCKGGRKQFLTALSFMGISERQMQRSF